NGRGRRGWESCVRPGQLRRRSGGWCNCRSYPAAHNSIPPVTRAALTWHAVLARQENHGGKTTRTAFTEVGQKAAGDETRPEAARQEETGQKAVEKARQARGGIG